MTDSMEVAVVAGIASSIVTILTQVFGPLVGIANRRVKALSDRVAKSEDDAAHALASLEAHEDTCSERYKGIQSELKGLSQITQSQHEDVVRSLNDTRNSVNMVMHRLMNGPGHRS